MESGDLFCPKCHSGGMNKYLYYESNNLSRVTYWIFYNTKEKSNSWKCWCCCEAILGHKPKKWYDPCGWCFNPCKAAGTPRDIYAVDGYGNKLYKVNDDAHSCCAMFCCLIWIFVCYFIYALYVIFFCWCDIYNYFCNKKVTKEICLGNSESEFSDDDNFWNNIKGDELYTEKYWTRMHPNLFRCLKCGWTSNSFLDFLDVNQKNTKQVSIINSNDISNNNINNTTTVQINNNPGNN